MKPTVTAAVALVWFALAAPSGAAAFAGAAYDTSPSLRIEARGGASRFDWLSGRGITFGRPLCDRRHNLRAHGFRHYGGDRMPPSRAILRSLGAREFFRISYPRPRCGLYHALARDAYGRRVHLVIDRYSGNIIRLRYR